MRKLALLLLVVACTTAIPANRYGLRVVPDLRTFERLVREDPSKRLVNVRGRVYTDVRYATPDNFMKQTLYSVSKVYLRVQAANALMDANEELAERGLAVKVFDGYRPYAITELMWERIKNPDFVADPAKGSRHNRGAAVDLTLMDRRTGVELAMPTPYDDFTPRARHDFNDLPADVIANRALLRDVMVRHGFEPLPSEWWHYDFKGWERFELMNVSLKALEAHEAREPVPIPW
ncbi:MAG TPA: M15 family metallopeptidase [Thermoanaerobaculia bacterium]|nr:M15 family metallopeptidase [Thermoanaerobaculia bacterium]